MQDGNEIPDVDETCVELFLPYASGGLKTVPEAASKMASLMGKAARSPVASECCPAMLVSASWDGMGG